MKKIYITFLMFFVFKLINAAVITIPLTHTVGTITDTICYVGFTTSTSPTYVYQSTGLYTHYEMYVNVNPGDVIEITEGVRLRLRFVGFNGNSANPIIIRNKSTGIVSLTNGKANTTYNYGIAIRNCNFIHLTGSGNSTKYGFQIDGIGIIAQSSGFNGFGDGITIDGYSSDIEVDRVSIKNVGAKAVGAKEDPFVNGCYPSIAELSNYYNFVMKNMFFHDLYIDSTGSEGFYIGITGYNEGKGIWKLNCCNFENSTDMGGQNGGTGAAVIPHWLNNVKIYNNEIKHTGWESIQLCMTYNFDIYNNTIDDDGWHKESGQMSGILIGEPTQHGYVRDNKTTNAHGVGISCFGKELQIKNNLIIKPTKAQYNRNSLLFGIYLNDKAFLPVPSNYFLPMAPWCEPEHPNLYASLNPLLTQPNFNLSSITAGVFHNTIVFDSAYYKSSFNVYSPQGIHASAACIGCNGATGFIIENNLISYSSICLDTISPALNPQAIFNKFSYPTTNSLNNYVFSGALGNLSGPKFVEKNPNNSINTVGLNFFATSTNDISFNNPNNGDYRINTSTGVSPIDYCNVANIDKDLIGTIRPTTASLNDFGCYKNNFSGTVNNNSSFFFNPNPINATVFNSKCEIIFPIHFAPPVSSVLITMTNLLSFGATQTIYSNSNSGTIPTITYLGSTQFQVIPSYPGGNPLAGIYVVTLYVNGVYTANRLIVVN